MNKAIFVHEINTSNCLYKEPKSFVLGEALAFRDLQEEITLWNVLHDKVVVLRVL